MRNIFVIAILVCCSCSSNKLRFQGIVNRSGVATCRLIPHTTYAVNVFRHLNFELPRASNYLPSHTDNLYVTLAKNWVDIIPLSSGPGKLELVNDEGDTISVQVVAIEDDVFKKNVALVASNKMSPYDDPRLELRENLRLIGHPAPDFSLVNPGIDSITKRQLRGKIAMINFWSRGCVPCQQEAPELSEVRAAYSTDTNVVFLACSTDSMRYAPGTGEMQFLAYEIDGSDDTTMKWQSDDSGFDFKQFRFRHFFNGQTVSHAFGVYGIPRTFIIDASGIVRATFTGYSPGNTSVMLTAKIREIRARYPNP